MGDFGTNARRASSHVFRVGRMALPPRLREFFLRVRH